MTNTERTILQILAAAEREMLELAIVLRSAGGLKRGVLYVYLQRLEERGCLTSRLESEIWPLIAMPRRLYRITEGGRRVLSEETATAGTLGFD